MKTIKKLNHNLWITILTVILSSFGSCSTFFSSSILIDAPEDVRKAALNYAQEYVSLGAIYEWGGQDPLPKIIK
jgi:hypothetical protein